MVTPSISSWVDYFPCSSVIVVTGMGGCAAVNPACSMSASSLMMLGVILLGIARKNEIMYLPPALFLNVMSDRIMIPGRACADLRVFTRLVVAPNFFIPWHLLIGIHEGNVNNSQVPIYFMF